MKLMCVKMWFPTAMPVFSFLPTLGPDFSAKQSLKIANQLISRNRPHPMRYLSTWSLWIPAGCKDPLWWVAFLSQLFDQLQADAPIRSRHEDTAWIQHFHISFPVGLEQAKKKNLWWLSSLLLTSFSVPGVCKHLLYNVQMQWRGRDN